MSDCEWSNDGCPECIMLHHSICIVIITATAGTIHCIQYDYKFWSSKDSTGNSIYPAGAQAGIFKEKYVNIEICILLKSYLPRISSWNFVRAPKAKPKAISFSLKFSTEMLFLALYVFARLFWRAREMLVKQPPAGRQTPCVTMSSAGMLLAMWD